VAVCAMLRRISIAGSLMKMTETSSQTDLPDTPLADSFEQPDMEQWRALVEKVLAGRDFEQRLVSRTADNLAVGPLYTRADQLPAAAEARPGAPPFTRGTVAADHPPRISPLHVERNPALLAQAITEDMTGGADAVTIRIEAPGQSGLPPDFHALEAALAAIPLDRLRIDLDAGDKAIHAALALATIARRRGRPPPQTQLGLGIDPLGVLARTGELWLLKPDCSGFALGIPWLPPPCTSLIVDTRPYHEAGASESQDLAALAATLVAYLRACEGEGLSPSDALPRIALSLAADADIFLGLAKLRAARRIAWRIADACGAGEAAGRMRLQVTTSERMMTQRDPWVNMLRVTVACAAAIMGGATAITALPFTWPLGQPDAFARRIARNVPLVLLEESSLHRIVDPAGGAWAVEKLTDELARKAWVMFQEWESRGGMQAVLIGGLVQDQIAAVAEARATALATGKLALTGTTAFPRLGDDGVKISPWPGTPALPPHPVARPLPQTRLSEPFERLRDAADAAPVPPTVFLAALGTSAEHGARSTWATNVLAPGGIAVSAGNGYTNSTDIGRAFAESGASVACICGTDEAYAQLGEAAAMALKSAGATHVWLAGAPGRDQADLKAAGVDGFLHAGCDVVSTLRTLHQQLGVPAL
ncbi:MAG: methylmalonyl-CoA mutase family protein, partial [Hyphomicrobiaceae bacterium]